MATLHLINHHNAIGACLAVAAAEDAVLLIEDGVYAAAANAPPRPLYALDVDVQARGLSGRLGAGVAVVNDAQFVELVTGHCPIVTWS